MLNGDLKERALSELKAADREYQDVEARVIKQAEELYQLRQFTSKAAITAFETYINTLANSPKEFDKSVAEFKLEYAKFTELIYEIESKAAQDTTVGGSVTEAGVAAGVGVASEFGKT